MVCLRWRHLVNAYEVTAAGGGWCDCLAPFVLAAYARAKPCCLWLVVLACVPTLVLYIWCVLAVLRSGLTTIGIKWLLLLYYYWYIQQSVWCWNVQCLQSRSPDLCDMLIALSLLCSNSRVSYFNFRLSCVTDSATHNLCVTETKSDISDICFVLFGLVFLQCFDTVGWVIWPVKTRPRYDL